MAIRGGERMKILAWRRNRRQTAELAPPQEARKIVMASEVFYVRPMRVVAENEHLQQPHGLQTGIMSDLKHDFQRGKTFPKTALPLGNK